MQVINEIDALKEENSRAWSNESMQADFAFVIAEKFIEALFKKGLISKVEREKISQLNKETFQPFYKEILE